ncbi:MAG: glycosyl hydrolase 53 family protein [Lachnospiraceae bacterium]|nr:glycosyl hydrolase 53 family protein [Lachnospiraceae bacterium]
MKKIALITDGWRRYITYAWVDGIINRAKELGLDICLYTFNTNGNLSHDAKYNRGEYGLYELPDYDSYDGFIFDCTNTTDPAVIDSVVSKLKGQSAPVVSISYFVEGFHYVGNDNKGLIRAMIDHMYHHHGCRRMVYAGGPENNYENRQRFEAFCEAHRDYGLPLTEENYMFGDYDYDTGVRYLSEWLASGKDLPDAFICANDNIAAGMCAEAERRELKIPDDFRVTGFDNLDKAAYYRPQIATVNHNRGILGSRALDILLRLMDGEQVDQYTYVSSKIVPAESCGCGNTGDVDYRLFAKWQIDWGVERDRHEENILELENRFAECKNMDGLFESFADYVSTLDCTGMFIWVDKTLLEARPDGRLSVQGIDRNRMKVVYGCDNGEKIYSVRDYDDLLDYLRSAKRSRSYVFFPIHFRDETVGATTLLEPVFLYNNPFFYDVHNTFIERLQNLYRQTQLANAAEEMRNLYNKDVLTGLFNRITYNEMIAPRFGRYKSEGVTCAMVFFDVDYFKRINDTYGHDFGDRVLIMIANTIKQAKPKDSFAYRFGGDEFVVFMPYAYKEKVERFIYKVDRRLEARRIEMSCGYIMTDPGSDRTLDEYLVMADQHMYEVKKERKGSLLSRMFSAGQIPRPDLSPDPDDYGKHFLKGVDISNLPEREDRGCRFYDSEGNEKDPMELLAENGVNSVRLRIWNEPGNVPESGGYCDLKHTLEMAERIKSAGMSFVLDFHYSDYWADPGQQRKPESWKKLTFDELVRAVYDYTTHVLVELSKVDALPDMVQIGNEIRSGMLFPDGAVPDYQSLAKLVNAGIEAVRDLSVDIKIMIHLDQGGRFYYLRDWFDAMFAAGMDRIDAIGISFYSFWHGTFADLKDSMTQLIDRYDLPVYVVETAHPWRHCEGEHVSEDMMHSAGLQAGIEEQKKSLELVMQIAAEVSDGRDTGVYYWEPLCITDMDFGSWDENMGMLNTSHEALSSFAAFREFDPLNPPIGDIDSYIEKMYEYDDARILPAGTNLIPNGDFSNELNGWWLTRNPDSVTVVCENREVYLTSQTNFTLELCRELRISKKGVYCLSVSYRGTNTTGVDIRLFLKVITCNGEKLYEKPIYPSDLRFETYSMEPIKLDAESVSVGVRISSPPVFGRIADIRLTEV